MTIFQDNDNSDGPNDLSMSLDSGGLGPNGFTFTRPRFLTSNAGDDSAIEATLRRKIYVDAGLAWDRSGKQYHGRVYLIYTTKPTYGTNDNTDIKLAYSADSGTNWTLRSSPINDDGTTRSQFWPRIAVDQISGNVAVSWYDCRNDTGNTNTQFFAAVSKDGGVNFSANILLEPGQSNAGITDPFEYGDYTGLAYHAGLIVPAWGNNSNSTLDNPNGINQMDIYVARLPY